MPNIAVIENGTVVNVIAAGDDWTEHFPDAVLAPSASIGDLYADGAFSAPASPAPTKDDLSSYAALKRLSVETGGITVDGTKIDTSRESQSLISGADAYMQAASVADLTFKAASGWTTLTAAQVHAIALAVAAHVQASFAAEKVVSDAIAAGTISTTAEIDAASWPANS